MLDAKSLKEWAVVSVTTFSTSTTATTTAASSSTITSTASTMRIITITIVLVVMTLVFVAMVVFAMSVSCRRRWAFSWSILMGGVANVDQIRVRQGGASKLRASKQIVLICYRLAGEKKASHLPLRVVPLIKVVSNTTSITFSWTPTTVPLLPMGTEPESQT